MLCFILLANGVPCGGHKMYNAEHPFHPQSILGDHIHGLHVFKHRTMKRIHFVKIIHRLIKIHIYLLCIVYRISAKYIWIYLFHRQIIIIWLIHFRRCLRLSKINVHIVFLLFHLLPFITVYCHVLSCIHQLQFVDFFFKGNHEIYNFHCARGNDWNIHLWNGIWFEATTKLQ